MFKKLLVVDDERDMLAVLVKRLRGRGYEVLPARDGWEAMALAKNNDFDLFILDIMMPGMDGGDIAQGLRDDARTRNIPVIFLTALQTKRDQDVPTRAGAQVVLAKPYDFEQLAAKVDEMTRAPRA